ncbi:kinetochore Sim4 complex subunit FTA2-domain-containing protein [Biscogniauxia marginata]|nr:kinetochore Sim4 complex subunit FTA2-domain-containing protein [Biscogniauxia marginata]
MAELIPNIQGPKLFPFPGNFARAQFVKLLSSEVELNSSSEGPHSRVFQVILEGKKYAVKIFKFISIDDIRIFAPMQEHRVKDDLVRYQLDPFFAECRAFGRLVERGKDDKLAVKCYGYVFLSKAVERRLEQQFGIHDWNRQIKDRARPLRAIVKDYIRHKSFQNRKPFIKMRNNIEELNKMGIYNMDIRKENYLGGRLFDFSIAITSPHLSLWTELRTKEQILDDMNSDLKLFDSIVKEVNEEKGRMEKERRERRRTRERNAKRR